MDDPLMFARTLLRPLIYCPGRLLAGVLLLAGHVAPPGSAAEPSGAPDKGPGWAAERPAEGPFVETDQGFMVPYATTIPGTDIEYQMMPVPGGTFRMGSGPD